MKDLKADIERSLAAKLKSYGKADDAKDRKMMAAHETKMHGVKHRAAGGAIEGGIARPRMDRKPGKAGGKKGNKGTTVNVVIASKDKGPGDMPMPPMPPMGAGPGPMPPPKPPMPPAPPGPPAGGPPMPPPGAGPGGPPMPMRASGGRLGMTAGAASGEGRLEKEAIQKRER